MLRKAGAASALHGGGAGGEAAGVHGMLQGAVPDDRAGEFWQAAAGADGGNAAPGGAG